MMRPSPVDRRAFVKSSVGVASYLAGTSVLGATANIPSTIQGVSNSEAAAISRHVIGFMQKYDVPGLSLAMTFQGKLKLLVCVGYAERENRTPIQPRHRFRIASVSKPITSITAMLLGQQGKLKLDQPIFGAGVLGFKSQISTLPEISQRRLLKLTTRQLLEHTGGGWGNDGADPMFAAEASRFDHDRLIAWTLENRPLQNDPGTNYEYSNFGYCLVGRVLEKRAGTDYERVVRSRLLEPFQMSDLTLKVGLNSKSARQRNEVVYYGQGEDAYGMNVKRMDAHGGWVGSPTDLVRLINRVDGFDSPADILNDDWIRFMTTPSKANPNYAKGWSVNRSGNWWHTGSFNGGSSIMARINDGHCWAMTMNTRSKLNDYFSAVDNLPWKIRESVRHWGTHDLF